MKERNSGLLNDASSDIARYTILTPQIEGIPFDELSDVVLEKFLGSGCFSSVFLASNGDEKFAIKLCEIDIKTPELWALRSKSLMGRMKPENTYIVDAYKKEYVSLVGGISPKALSIGITKFEDVTYLFLSMSFIDGRTVQKITDEAYSTKLRAPYLEFSLSLFLSLSELHEKGVSHNDIHIGNIMVAEKNKVFLIDFESTGDTQTFPIDVFCAATVCFLVLFSDIIKANVESSIFKADVGLLTTHKREFPEILLRCFDEDENKRPTALEVCSILENTLSK